MKRNRFSEERIIGILKEHEAGVSVADLCRKHGVSDASIYKWKAKFGGMGLRGQAAEDAGGRANSPKTRPRWGKFPVSGDGGRRQGLITTAWRSLQCNLVNSRLAAR